MSSIAEVPLNFDRNAVHSANATYRVDFPVPIGEAATNRGVGKGDKLAGSKESSNDQYKGLSDANLADDVETTLRDLNLITRSVASSTVSQSLGLNSVVAEAYAKAPDGSDIGVSALASGTQLVTNVTDEAGNPVATITRDFDFQRPDIQKGLYNLEAVDYLTGQIDRHGGNILINNDTGAVEGIDNDLCLGDKPLSVALRDGNVGAKAVGVPPLYYHQDTAAAIEQITPAKLTAFLSSVKSPDGGKALQPEEIKAAVDRLQTMQASILLARAEGRVVADFDKNTFDASVAHHQANAGEINRGKFPGAGNYVGRSDAELNYAKAASLQDHSVDHIEPPGKGITPTDYEAGLKAAKADVQTARAQALAAPGPDLALALQEKQAAEAQVKALREKMVQTIQTKPGLDTRLEIQAKAYEALKTNRADLAATTTTPALSEKQVKLIQTMVPGMQDIQAGDRLTPEQNRAVNLVCSNLGRRNLADARDREVTAQMDHVRSADPATFQDFNTAVARLETANTQVENQLTAEVRVQNAVTTEKTYVDSQKPVLHQAQEQKVQAAADAAKAAAATVRAAEVAKLTDLATSVAESNNISVEQLNLTRGGNLQTSSQLRNSAINMRDDAAAAKLAGDQMAGTIDHATLNESEQTALDGTLQQLGQGSDLEVAKMYARGQELHATADVQDKFSAISKAIESGQEPTQEQLESFGASVQALSDCTQKAKLATQNVSDSIETRIRTGLEDKVGPLLDQKGYTPAEKAASIDAMTSAAMDIDIMKLRDTDERASLYVSQMEQSIRESEFNYPGGNKVHEAVYRAFDSAVMTEKDGNIAIKPAGGGQTFNEKRANEHITKALEKNGIPAPSLMEGEERQAALNSQLDAGKERVAIYEARNAQEGLKGQTIHNLNDHIQQLTERKEQLQNNPSAGDRLKALLKHGPKGISGEIDKIDKEIAATQKALDMTRGNVSVADQKAQLDQLKTDYRQGKAQIDQVKQDLKQAENTLKAVDTKATLGETALDSSMSQSARDALVKQANQAINVREALKPQVKQLKEEQDALKTEIKQGEKAVSVRDKMSPKTGQPAAAQQASSHKV